MSLTPPVLRYAATASTNGLPLRQRVSETWNAPNVQLSAVPSNFHTDRMTGARDTSATAGQKTFSSCAEGRRVTERCTAVAVALKLLAGLNK